MKVSIFTFTLFVFLFFCLLVVFSDEISEEITHNLNRNLDVDWGDDHPKFKKQNLNVDLLGMSINWDYFNIYFPLIKGAHILGTISSIKSTGCISRITFLLNIHIDISCNEVSIEIKKNKWAKNGELYISRTSFFERRVFDDFFDRQGNYNVTIVAKNIFINNVNLGHYFIEYSFIDTENFQLMINGEDFLLSKRTEGLNIHTADADFFILNQNFYEDTM